MAEDKERKSGTRRLREEGPQGTVFIAPGELPDLEEGSRSNSVTPDSPALVGLSPPFVDQWFPLEPERTQIGRKLHNQVVLDEPSVSFEHARIIRSGGEWRVVNLLSTNGTFINGQRVHQARLEHGDRVAFGNAAFLFATSESVEPSARSFHQTESTPFQRWVSVLIVLAGIAAAAALYWFL